eukprot:GHVQ01013954.1.p1 GENE.GHVQ01013954.1~~GHVQ01013954.1.p1  ORF type:complete len:367 (+),score=45.92 GHVQ01013954.1:274-1374(+)
MSAYKAMLTKELRAVDGKLRPLRIQYRRKAELVAKIKPILESASNGQLQTFGSCENGFWIRASDVDACLVVKNCASKAACVSKLRMVSKLLRDNNIGDTIVISAQVPIAKAVDPKTKDTVCDLSINNTAALENSLLTGTLSRVDHRVQPLGRFIKHWAMSRKINDRSQGTLSTYALLLQLFYFLQVTSPPILPLYQDIEIVQPAASGECSHDWMSGQLRKPPFVTDVRKVNEELFLGYNKNKQSLGELIFDFFQLFGDDKFGGGDIGATVQIYDGSITDNDLGVLALICPITKKNVNPFKRRAWSLLHAEFKRAKEMLEENRSLAEICEVRRETPLRSHAGALRKERRRKLQVASALGLTCPSGST